MTRKAAALAVLLVVGSPAALRALDLAHPAGTETRREASAAASVRLPDRPFGADGFAREVDGAVVRRVFRVPGGVATTLQLLAPLRETLTEAGYEVVFDCSDDTCGGFDFRFALDLLAGPEMFVDLGDYRYLLARNLDAARSEPVEVSVVVSRSPAAGFVHLTEVFRTLPDSAEPLPDAVEAAVADALAPPGPPVPAPPLAQAGAALADGGFDPDRFEAEGRAVLSDLEFASGSADLGSGDYPSLTGLARWMANHPQARIALVGHTDAVGSLAANTALSLRRARSVADRLLAEDGVAAAQVEAQGAGYLAPRASNLEPEGRALNRRVEAVLLSLGD